VAKKLFNQTAQFKALQKEWYSLLKETGFDDIEAGDKNGIIQPQVFVQDKTQSSGGLSYFEFCHQILREYRFKKEIHRTIFSLHTEGMSERDIVRHLSENHGIKFSQQGINVLINRVKESFLKGER
jgi:hypothetical protein